MRAECAVYIIRDNHQVGVIILHNIDNSCHRFRTEGVTGRIAGISDEERFDGGIFQAVDVLVIVLPKVEPVVRHAVGMQLYHVELVAAQLRNFDIRSEGGHHKGDAVTFVQQEVFLKGVEEVTHGGGSAFGGKEVECAAWRAVIAHFLRQVILHQYFGEVQDAVGHRVLVADDGFCPFMHQGVGIGGMLH